MATEQSKCSHEKVDIDAANEAAVKEKVNIFRDPMDNTIYFESRLVAIMIKHKTNYVDTDHNTDFDMMEFLASFDSTYEFVHILDDFVLYLTQEREKKDRYTEKIYNKLIQNDEANKCDMSCCICMKRNKTQSYSTDLEAEDIAYHSLMDNIHVHLFHSFDLGLRLTSKEKQSIRGTAPNDDDAKKEKEEEEETRTDRIALRYREFIDAKAARNGLDRRSSENSKFVTRINDEKKNEITFRDSAMSHLASMDRDTTTNDKDMANVDIIGKWMKDELFDTDSLCTYIALQNEENKNNLSTTAPADVAILTELRRYLINNDPQKIYYSFGFRFYYWDFYKENEAETNIIRVDMTNKRQKKWFDAGNANYRCCEWYIPPRFADIKGEALNSGFIDIAQWIAKQEEAKFKLQQRFCRVTLANDFWQRTYGIEPDAPLALRHVISIILYTHCSKFCFAFSASFRKSSPFETAKSLKYRHSAYHHCAKALRELIEAYGTEIKYMGYDKFYHGISCQMYFKTCHARICGPMSTTIDQTVAFSIFAKDRGIVLHLVNDKGLSFCLDCDQFSCYSNEKEVLFCGGFSPIPFDAIYICEEQLTLSKGIKMIGVLDKMFSSSSNERKIFKKEMKLIRSLIQDEAKHVTGSKRSIKINAYEADLFRCFCQNLEEMKCDMYLMSNNELHQGEVDKALETKLYGYQTIYDVFFNDEFDFLKLALVLDVFPKLKRIVMKSWITVQYSESKAKAVGLMEFVLSALSNHLTAVHKLKKIIVTLAIPMRIDNKHCPKEHELTPFDTDEDGYFCDKCDKEFPENTAMFGCLPDGTEDECDYCVCLECFEVKNLDVVYLREAVAEFEPTFMQQIGWKVEVAKHTDHLEHEFDAIMFTKI